MRWRDNYEIRYGGGGSPYSSYNLKRSRARGVRKIAGYGLIGLAFAALLAPVAFVMGCKLFLFLVAFVAVIFSLIVAGVNLTVG